MPIAQRICFAIASGMVATCVLAACGAGDLSRPQPSPETLSDSEEPGSTPISAPTPSRIAAGPHGPAVNVSKPIKRPNSDDQTKEGLENFVRYFIELSGYGFETGEVDEWLHYTSPDVFLTYREGAWFVDDMGHLVG